MRKSRKLRQLRRISCKWDRSPYIRRVGYKSKLGNSKWGKWLYFIMYSGVPIPTRNNPRIEIKKIR